MKSYEIVTLTVNPSLDKSTKFHGLAAEQKLRCEAPKFDAGGGGINVSKAIARLGGESLCVFTSGGPTGEMLESLLRQESIAVKPIAVAAPTRENMIALDTSTNKQYRFGFPGESLLETELNEIESVLIKLKPKYLVASGSLNENLSADYYSKIAKLAAEAGSRFIVDTSGDALREVLNTGVYLVKPNVGELAKLVGVEKLEANEADDAALSLIEKGCAEIIVVSLGPQGAVLVTKNENIYVPAPNVVKKSTVGAGDSMVGGMVWALSQNKSLKEVVQWGVACGTAATMNEGTQLFKAEDAQKLFTWLHNK